MGALGHYLEAAGVPTTGISLIREHTERVRPPRALWVPFELGRPLGAPDAPAFQRRVAAGALNLLERPAGPVLEVFPEDAPPAGNGDAPWACPVSLDPPAPGGGAPGLVAALEAEVRRLRPWYDLHVRRTGRTAAGVSGLDPEAVVGFLGAFLTGAIPESPRAELSTAVCLRLAAQDLRAFHFEAVTAQPGTGAPGSRAFAEWFWGETAAGRALRAVGKVCQGAADPGLQTVGQRFLVPVGGRGG